MYTKKYNYHLQDKYIIIIMDIKVQEVLCYKIMYLKNNLINFMGKEGQGQDNYNRKM